MTGIGIIGVGFMGYTHFEAAKKLNGAKVTAIATRSPKKLEGDWTGIQGNFGPPAGQVDLTDVCLLYTSPSPRDKRQSRMPSSA